MTEVIKIDRACTLGVDMRIENYDWQTLIGYGERLLGLKFRRHDLQSVHARTDILQGRPKFQFMVVRSKHRKNLLVHLSRFVYAIQKFCKELACDKGQNGLK